MYNMTRKGHMDILLNPNVAYLVLVIGFLITIMALFTPGTGILEVVGISMLVVAGWQISKLTINYVALVLLLIGVFPFLLALRKTRKWYHFVIALAALVLGSTFLFVSEGWRPVVNPFLSVIVNILLIGFFWLVIRKLMDAINKPVQNKLKESVGSIGYTKTKVFKEGSVYVNSELWSARSAAPIEENKRIRVVGRDGFILEVEEFPQPENQDGSLKEEK